MTGLNNQVSIYYSFDAYLQVPLTKEATKMKTTDMLQNDLRLKVLEAIFKNRTINEITYRKAEQKLLNASEKENKNAERKK